MNAEQKSTESYCFSLQELRRIAADELPQSVADFLALLAVYADIALGGEGFKRQQEIDEQKLALGDD